MSTSIRLSVLTLAAAVFPLTFVGAAPARLGTRQGHCIPTNQEFMDSNPSCDLGYVGYELAYDSAGTGYVDTGEEADEPIVCTEAHETCGTNCPTLMGKIYSPSKPVFEYDDVDMWVYWLEYAEEEPYTNPCNNSCVNGYTDVLTQVLWGESDDYPYSCYQ